eukprot:sb/3461951/
MILKRSRDELVSIVKKNAPFGMEKVNMITNQLISIEFELRKSHVEPSRKSFYEDLVSEVVIEMTIPHKDLKKRAFTFLNRSNENKIKELYKPLKAAVDVKLAAQIASYNSRLASYNERIEAWKKTMESLPEGAEEVPKPKGVTKTFKWDADTRKLFGELTKEKEVHLKLLRFRTDEQVDLMQTYLSRLIPELWPGGWMTVKILMKEAEAYKNAITPVPKTALTTATTAKKKPSVTVNPIKTTAAKPSKSTKDNKQTKPSKVEPLKATKPVKTSEGAALKTTKSATSSAKSSSNSDSSKPGTPDTSSRSTSIGSSTSSSKSVKQKPSTTKAAAATFASAITKLSAAATKQVTDTPSSKVVIETTGEETAPRRVSLAPIPVSKSGEATSESALPKPVAVSQSKATSKSPVPEITPSKPSKSVPSAAVAETAEPVTSSAEPADQPAPAAEVPKVPVLGAEVPKVPFVPVITESAALKLQNRMRQLQRQNEITKQQSESNRVSVKSEAVESMKSPLKCLLDESMKRKTPSPIATTELEKSGKKDVITPTTPTAVVAASPTSIPVVTCSKPSKQQPVITTAQVPTVTPVSKSLSRSLPIKQPVKQSVIQTAAATKKPQLILTKPVKSENEQLRQQLARVAASIDEKQKSLLSGKSDNNSRPTVVVQKPTAKRPAPQTPSSAAPHVSSIPPEVLGAIKKKYGHQVNLSDKNTLQSILQLELQQATRNNKSPTCVRTNTSDVIMIDDDRPSSSSNNKTPQIRTVPKTSPIKIVSSSTAVVSNSPLTSSHNVTSSHHMTSSHNVTSSAAPRGVTPTSLPHSVASMMKNDNRISNLGQNSRLSGASSVANSNRQSLSGASALQSAQLQSLLSSIQSMRDKGKSK